MKLKPIITSLLENDLYKYSMGQCFFHRHNGKQAEWAFRCRSDVHFSPEEVQEIREQAEWYASLRYTEEELEYLHSAYPWLRKDYTDFLRFWHPRLEEIIISEDAPCGLSVRFKGSCLNVSPYETPVMAMITETHYRMSGRYDAMLAEYKAKAEDNISKLKQGIYAPGIFSEFGFRRRLSYEAQDYFIRRIKEENIPGFIGTSDVFFAKKYGIKAAGTMAHEFVMLAGQSYPERNPAYSNRFMLESWTREYGILNGIALTDTIGTEPFLKDFTQYYASLFSGVRHDSADPYEWGEKMIAHYKALGIDPMTKTLLFSDSLDLERATAISRHFKGRAKVAFGIGTALVGPASGALNIVIKPVAFDGLPVAKLSDAPGKNMCEDPEYVEYLKRSIKWRLEH